MSTSIWLETVSELDGGLLLTGVPFGRGQLAPGTSLVLRHGAHELPSWTTERAAWPDGSVKWVFLHARVPRGRSRLELATGGAASSRGATSLDAAGTLRAGGMELSCLGGAIRCVTPHGAWRLDGDTVATDLERPPAEGALEIELVEPSPIAPLARLRAPRAPGADGLCVEYFARLDPVHSRIVLQRRMSWNRAGRYTLCSASARIALEGGVLPAGGEGRLVVPAPGKVLSADGKPTDGHPEGRADLPGLSVWIEKAWQRAPFSLRWSRGEVEVGLYAAEARPLGVTGGTSFRHTLHVATGPGAADVAGRSVEVVLDAAHITGSGALGIIADPATCRRDFPGYEQAFRATLESGRLDRLSRPSESGAVVPDGEPVRIEQEERQDTEYFGLQHYGDWPMPWGSYGITGRRMYASNEYDPAYAYFQGYAIYGDWRLHEVARASAEHMTDVDVVSTTGDMRYHGYYDGAENHEHARSEGEYGHYWTDGYWMLYFLCGDLWAREAALGVTDFLVARLGRWGEDYLRSVWAGAERNLGWPMVALMASCESAGHEGALQTIRRIVAFVERYVADPDRDLEEQCGTAQTPVSWWRTAMQDGCKPFMMGVVMEGLERYHRMTGDDRAGASIVGLARWMVEEMWIPHEATFVYEHNGYGRGHRLAKPQDLIPLFVRGLGYAAELSGDDRLREVSEKAFFGCLWTLYDPRSGGKSIGMIGRTLGSYVAMLDTWNRRERERSLASIEPSGAPGGSFRGGLRKLLDGDEISLVRGTPRFDGRALVSDDKSFVEARFRTPRCTHSGEIAFRVLLEPGSTTSLNKRCCIHLSDDLHTASAVSIIIFYTNLHVRVYDARRRIVEVAEGFIKDVDVKGAAVHGKGYPAWNEGEWHEVLARWSAPSPGRPGTLELSIDGVLADHRTLDRAIGGRFTRVSFGHKPGNWRLLGKLELQRLDFTEKER